MFGSTVHGNGTPNDLDLLAVYTDIEDFYEFHAALEQLEFAPLVDLIAMSSDEVTRSGFLRRSNAVALDLLVALDREALAPKRDGG